MAGGDEVMAAASDRDDRLPPSPPPGLPTTRLSEALDGAIRWLGGGFSLLWLAIIAVILISVFSRYALSEGSVFLEELSWHLSSAAWLVGLSYTLAVNGHVRVDVVHERLRPRGQAWIELLGILLLMQPFLAIGLYEGFPYFLSSYGINETSQAPAGLPWRWLIKAFIPLSFLLLIIAGLARLSRCTALLFGWPTPRWRE